MSLPPQISWTPQWRAGTFRRLKESPSDNSREESAWSSLWGLRVPSRVKSFLWRLAKVSLPTEDVRHHRNMGTNDCCSLCGMPDSWTHSLLQCSMSRWVWALADDEIIEALLETEILQPKLWLFQLRDKLSHDKFTKLLITSWVIWIARRKAIHEENFEGPIATNCFIQSYIEEINLSNRKLHHAPLSHGGSGSHAITWLGSRGNNQLEGKTMITCVGKKAEDGSGGVVSAICRDSQGLYPGSSALVLLGLVDVNNLDVIACREAQCLAEDLGISQLIIANSNKQLKKDIEEKKGGVNSSVIREILKRRVNFNSCSFSTSMSSLFNDASLIVAYAFQLSPAPLVDY